MTGPEITIPNWWPHAGAMICLMVVMFAALWIADGIGHVHERRDQMTQDEKALEAMAMAQFLFGFAVGTTLISLIWLTVEWPS